MPGTDFRSAALTRIVAAVFALAADGTPASGSPFEPTSDSGWRRIYSAVFSTWPRSSSPYGTTTLGFGNSYVLKPASNTWIGPGGPIGIPRLSGDFIFELRFRVSDRRPSASLNVSLQGAGDNAVVVNTFLELWSESNATYSIMKGKIKRAGLQVAHILDEELIKQREPLPSSIASYDWRRGGKITLRREAGRMSYLINDTLVWPFQVDLFAFDQLAIAAAFPSTVEITSVEIRVRP